MSSPHGSSAARRSRARYRRSRAQLTERPRLGPFHEKRSARILLGACRLRAARSVAADESGAARRLRDRLDHLAGGLVLAGSCDIGLREHADQFVLAHDDRPWPTTRTATSRSVTIPTSRAPSSTTGSEPTSSCSISCAASRINVLGVTARGLSVITSPIFVFMFAPFLSSRYFLDLLVPLGRRRKPPCLQAVRGG